ncbi:HAMP domain-containing sensor histidine kinase [Glaciihabitans sp. UYNi722]|uniref:sensor histidine kinase n=1 Tax=Glaciihabitans sp. UYNi722 TaxID=3156344 RepID=UPI00339727DF
MLNRLSLRARLTVGSILIAVVFFGAAVVVVRINASAVLSTSDRTLASADLVPLVSEIGRKPHSPVDDSGKGSLVYVSAPDGDVQLDSMPEEIRSRLQRRAPADEEFIAGPDDSGFIVVGRKVVTADGTWGLWAARSTASSDLAMDSFDRLFVIGGLVLVILFGAASWLLGTAALRPVTRMRRQAENLSAAEGAAGLPLGPARDEISALAVTLNAFLSRVRAASAREKQVVSDAAHELRTPLAALRTQLELTHGHLHDPTILAEQIGSAERSVDRLSSLADNLLALSRLEAGEEVHGSASADELASELMDSVDRARLIALAKDIDVSFTLDVRTPTNSFALSPTGFSRVVDNLTANAIVAVPPGGNITVALRIDDNGLDLVVGDDGSGMPDDFVGRAFDHFSRADSSRTGETGGSGLGLALVHALCDAAGGTVAITNTHPGLEVEVRLPNM